jgi:hypothetical protein
MIFSLLPYVNLPFGVVHVQHPLHKKNVTKLVHQGFTLPKTEAVKNLPILAPDEHIRHQHRIILTVLAEA